MYEILIVIHAMVTVSLIVIILMQRSSSDGTGLSGGSGNSFMTGRAAASFLTRTTSLLGAVFILLSLGIGVVSAHNSNKSSIIDKIESQKATTSSPAKEAGKKEEPVKPSVPRPQ